VASGAAAAAAALPGAGAQDNLYLLKSGNIERLRLDFNSSRGKVRLLTILSPT
jgi:hypothetical protein